MALCQQKKLRALLLGNLLLWSMLAGECYADPFTDIANFTRNAIGYIKTTANAVSNTREIASRILSDVGGIVNSAKSMLETYTKDEVAALLTGVQQLIDAAKWADATASIYVSKAIGQGFKPLGEQLKDAAINASSIAKSKIGAKLPLGNSFKTDAQHAQAMAWLENRRPKPPKHLELRASELNQAGREKQAKAIRTEERHLAVFQSDVDYVAFHSAKNKGELSPAELLDKQLDDLQHR